MEIFDNLSQKQRKKIIKEEIIYWISKEAGGRLTVFGAPEKTGADLVVKKRGEYGEKSLRLYLQVFDCKKSGDKFIKKIENKDFKLLTNYYLVFVFFDVIKQKIAEFLWLLPSGDFKWIAGSNLEFKASPRMQDKDPYIKFLITKKELASFLSEILETKDFKWPKTFLKRVLIVDSRKLKEFIIEAREKTSLKKGTPVSSPRLIDSKQLDYKKKGYFYRNIYFLGNKNIIGQEVVYQTGKVIWGMVYFGLIIPEEIKEFLGEALLKLVKESRFGQRCHFEREGFYYKDEGRGDIEKFEGEEKIFVKGKEVYRLKYLGGLIRE